MPSETSRNPKRGDSNSRTESAEQKKKSKDCEDGKPGGAAFEGDEGQGATSVRLLFMFRPRTLLHVQCLGNYK